MSNQAKQTAQAQDMLERLGAGKATINDLRAELGMEPLASEFAGKHLKDDMVLHPIECPHCHERTRYGNFCSHCGKPIMSSQAALCVCTNLKKHFDL